MTNEKIIQILSLHGIHCEIKGGRVIADDSYTMNGELHIEEKDLTGIKTSELFDWLGY